MPICFKMFIYVVPLLMLALSSGCVTTTAGLERRDRRTFSAQERATKRALTAAGESLVFFEIENPGARNQQQRILNFSGIVLTEDGHLLAPFTIRSDSDTRIQAWVGEQRYLARPLRLDEGLGMSILKIEPYEPLQPLDLQHSVDVRPGETVYAVITTDEDREFSPFAFQAFCQGIIQGRYRQYSLSPIPDLARGAPLYNSYGQLVGLTSQANAFILSDMVHDIQELLARSSGELAAGEEEDEDAWFGSILAPINPDYARLNDLPRSGLWLSHVFKDSSAYKAGFRSGDLLIELNDSPMRLTGPRAYRFFVQTLRPRENQPFNAVVIRDGKRIKGKGILQKRPEPDTLRAEDLGVTVSDIVEAMVIRFNLFESEGVLVTDINPGSPAATGRSFGDSLLRGGDVIVSIGGHPTPDVEAFGEALDIIRKEEPPALLVHFQRGATTGIEALNLRIGKGRRGEQP
jgi:serine protease Do